MLILRPYRKCDAEHIVSWIGDELAFRKWSADRYDHYPITADDMNAHYAVNAESDICFEMTAVDNGRPVGHLIMRYIDDKRETLRFGFIIVDTNMRGKGYGSRMLRLSLKYAFEILKVKKVTLGVFANNPSALRCYEAVGFRAIEGEVNTFSIMDEDWECIEMEYIPTCNN